MKWNHLPVAGGLYDQHPTFLEDCLVIFEAQFKQRKKESEQQKREMGRKGKKR